MPLWTALPAVGLMLLGGACLAWAQASPRVLRQIYDERVRKGRQPFEYDAFVTTHRFMFGLCGAVLVTLGIGVLAFGLAD